MDPCTQELLGWHTSRLSAGCRAGNCSAVLEHLREMRAQNLQPPASLCARILTMCIEKNEMQNAFQALNIMRSLQMRPDASMYATLIRTCEKRKLAKEAWQLYEEMKCHGLSTNLITCNALIRAAVDAGVEGQKVETLWATMQVQQVKPDINSYNALISMHLGGSRNPKGISRAIDLFIELQEVGLRPNVITYTAILGWASEDPPDTRVFKELERRSLLPDLPTYNELIISCARSKHPERALLIFKALQVQGMQPNLETYNALLGICKRKRQAEKASQLFLSMDQSGIEPDIQTYEAIISTCCRREHVQSAMIYFQDMQSRGIDPSIAAFNTMIDALGSHGCTDLIDRLLQSMVCYYPELDRSTFDVLLRLSLKDGDTIRTLRYLNMMKISGMVPPDGQMLNMLSAMHEGAEESLASSSG